MAPSSSKSRSRSTFILMSDHSEANMNAPIADKSAPAHGLPLRPRGGTTGVPQRKPRTDFKPSGGRQRPFPRGLDGASFSRKAPQRPIGASGQGMAVEGHWKPGGSL